MTPLRATAPRVLLHAEGVALFAAATWLYFTALDGAGWLFLVLVLAPDVAMAGYLGGDRAGAAAYNAAHTLVFPVALAAMGVAFGEPTAVRVALPWLAHIGADRALGFGLKYASGFQETHLGRV